jgi:hypothetical protein
MTQNGRYISLRLSDALCEAQALGADGFPKKCDETPVWELEHSSGRRFYICEYHIQCYWNFWLSFRDAIRDIWPVKR